MAKVEENARPQGSTNLYSLGATGLDANENAGLRKEHGRSGSRVGFWDEKRTGISRKGMASPIGSISNCLNINADANRGLPRTAFASLVAFGRGSIAVRETVDWRSFGGASDALGHHPVIARCIQLWCTVDLTSPLRDRTSFYRESRLRRMFCAEKCQ